MAALEIIKEEIIKKEIIEEDEEEIVEEEEVVFEEETSESKDSISYLSPFSSSSSLQLSIPEESISKLRFDQQLLLYYNHFFPFDLLYRWLSYGSEATFQNREFAFWNASNFFTRYQSFKNEEEFREILTHPFQIHGESTVIERMEIGPIYRKTPKQHSIPGVVPMGREFVIDIDMNDYNSVRTCCRDATVCSSCWILMTIAIKIINDILRRHLGFRHLLWVFSGRRGVHCWVCDESAKLLSSEERAAIIQYMSKPSFPFPPQMYEMYNNILLRYFETHVLPQQRLFDFPSMRESILKKLPKSVASALRIAWTTDTHDSCYRWAQLKKTYAASQLKCYSSKISEIVIEYTYPRFDVKVSEDLNHLLKSPFCVHPKTGFVSIPIDPLHCENFDPLKSVPSLAGLITQKEQDLRLFQQAKEHFYKSLISPLFL